jgi:uncharacterized RDD family membrane protein YckC
MFCSKCGQSVDATAAFCTFCGAPVLGAAQAQPAPSPAAWGAPAAAPQWVYAPWGDRALGYVVDGLVILGMVVALGLLTALFVGGLYGLEGRMSDGMEGAACSGVALFIVAGFFIGLWNRFYLIYTRGYSVGQGVMKLKVVDAQGQLLTPGRAFIRLIMHTLFGFVPFLPVLDFLWPLWDDHRQTLHDKVANSYVIYDPARR